MAMSVPRTRWLSLALALPLVVHAGAEAAALPIQLPDPAPPHSPSATPAADGCAAGAWLVAAPDPADPPNAGMPVQYETAHFAFRFNAGVASLDQTRAAGAYLEYVWDYFIGTIGFPQPFCGSATKNKVNVFIGRDYGLTAGADGVGNMAIWIGPGALTDRFGLAHEFTHALQVGSGGLGDSPYTGWMFESHANWMTVQLPEFRNTTHCSVLLKQYPHLYYGSTRTRYCNWQFFEYLKNKHGYAAVNDLWRKSPRGDDPARLTTDPFSVLAANLGWNQSQLNDFFGEWAMHNANWDYTNPDGSDQGAVYRSNYGGYDQETGEGIRAATVLDPIDPANRRFAVPDMWAPQRWGYNIVKLYPDRGATTISVTFRGIVQSEAAVSSLPGLANEPAAIPAPASDWRWGLIAVGADGKSRYTPLQRGARGEAMLALQPGDTGLYLMVMATPSTMHRIQWDQPYYSIYRYPWMAQFDGAMPERHQAGAAEPIPGGHRHRNGGGWVGPAATVADTAYVGPYARVISGTVAGRARIEDHAVVMDEAIVRDEAVVAGLTVLRRNTIIQDRARVETAMLGLGQYEQDIVLSGRAMHIGDVEQRGASFASGVYYGLVDQAAAQDPSRGAQLTAPVPEVTARPSHLWPR